MDKTQYSIKMDYNNARREVNQLKDLAGKIERQKQKLLECRDRLSKYWKSDSATAYLNKMLERSEDLQAMANFLRQIADTAGTVAKNTYDADKRALDLAKQRSFGGGGGGSFGGGGGGGGFR